MAAGFPLLAIKSFTTVTRSDEKIRRFPIHAIHRRKLIRSSSPAPVPVPVPELPSNHSTDFFGIFLLQMPPPYTLSTTSSLLQPLVLQRSVLSSNIPGTSTSSLVRYRLASLSFMVYHLSLSPTRSRHSLPSSQLRHLNESPISRTTGGTMAVCREYSLQLPADRGTGGRSFQICFRIFGRKCGFFLGIPGFFAHLLLLHLFISSRPGQIQISLNQSAQMQSAFSDR